MNHQMADAPDTPHALGDIRRILILGHTGFIGAHLVEVFRKNQLDIDIVGRSSPTVDLTSPADVSLLADHCDLRTAIIMCAAVKKEFGDDIDSFWQNVTMVVNMCRLLQRCPVRRFIFFSSAAVYGEELHNTNITEDTPPQPASYYGMAKHVGERLFQKVFDGQERTSLLLLRPPMIYGPGDHGSAYGPVGFVKAAVAGKPITLWGDGTERREFIFIDDLVQLVFRLTFREQSGVLNIASGHSYSFADTLEIISRFVPKELQVTSRPRTREKADHQFNNSVLSSLLPDFAFTSFEEGIRRTVDSEYPASTRETMKQ